MGYFHRMESSNHVHYGYGFSWRLSVMDVCQGMEMNRANDLLERALNAYECNDHVGLTDLMEFEIRDFLSTPEPEQDEEPVAWMNGMRNLLSWDKFYEDMTPLYLHPAPRPEFVRLSEEQIMKIVRADPDFDEMMWDKTAVRFARVIEVALEEKNK